jgi:UDP-N-acetylmuramate--alanine ligase
MNKPNLTQDTEFFKNKNLVGEHEFTLGEKTRHETKFDIGSNLIINIQQLKQQKKVHFIGIGGIGMSALALILREWKIPVQGSDLKEGYIAEKLRAAGVLYQIGHREENLSTDVSLVVQTSIIKADNPEILAAKSRKIPIMTRAELLSCVMSKYIGISIAGTHGKTSTTAMVALMLEANEFDPTVINGGIVHHYKSNSKIGSGKFLVAESDESDGSFVNLPTKIGAITNIEPEHLEFTGYGGSFEKQKSYFEQYLRQIPKDGICALCVDCQETEKLYLKNQQQGNLVSYSITKNADISAQNIVASCSGLTFDIFFKNGEVIKSAKINALGKHNVANSLVAVAIAKFLGLNNQQILNGLALYSGVKQRFTKVGEFNGATIIDDYAHHPTEIAATLESARIIAGKNQVICVVQPHKYSRLRDLFSQFCTAFFEADIVVVSEIYSAGQEPIQGFNQDRLIEGIRNSGHKNIFKLTSEKDLAGLLKPLIKSGDVVLCAGAGNITLWAADLQKSLLAL